jgi:hypothetical protein
MQFFKLDSQNREKIGANNRHRDLSGKKLLGVPEDSEKTF